MLPQGLGRRHRSSASPAPGQEISDPPVPAGHRPVWKGTAFGGARGRTDVPKIVDWYMDGKINIDDLITHTLPLERINDGFDLMTRASRSAASSSIDPIDQG